MTILKLNSLKLGTTYTYISFKTCLLVTLKEKAYLSYIHHPTLKVELVKTIHKDKVLSTNFRKSLKNNQKDVIDENVGQGCMLLSDRALAHT